MNAALLEAAAGVGIAAAGWGTAWITVRRTASGKIGTSEASVLWQQSQAMLTAMTADRDRAAAQRDRVIEAQAASVVPALASISEALGHITVSLADNAERLARIEAAIGTGKGGEGRGD